MAARMAMARSVTQPSRMSGTTGRGQGRCPPVEPGLGTTRPGAARGDARVRAVQYLFDLPNAPVPTPLSTDQQTLAASMRVAWAHFGAIGTPATAAVPWPSPGRGFPWASCGTRRSSPDPDDRMTSLGSGTAQTSETPGCSLGRPGDFDR
jgi:hypothetical protein